MNFPVWAPVERVTAFQQVVAPWLRGREVGEVEATTTELFHLLRGPAEQSQTMGPCLQMVCAVEAALWDVRGRRERLPLRRLWFADPADEVEVYASGIGMPLPIDSLRQMLDQGVRLFKLKLGMGAREDAEALQQLRRLLGDAPQIAVDANRGWTFEQAASALPRLEDHGVEWLEEPLRPEEEHRTADLQSRTTVAVAGGENVVWRPNEAVTAEKLGPWNVVQPDASKYCPIHVAVEVLRAAEGAGRRFVPHCLGSAPHHALSLQLAAGSQGPLCEWDVNPNSLRTELLQPRFAIENGRVRLPETPGLGWELP